MTGTAPRGFDFRAVAFYPDSMVHLWKKKETGIFYAVWMENGKQRKKSLKTRERRLASRRFKAFRRDLIAGKIRPLFPGTRQTLFPFSEEFIRHISESCEPTTVDGVGVSVAPASAAGYTP